MLRERWPSSSSSSPLWLLDRATNVTLSPQTTLRRFTASAGFVRRLEVTGMLQGHGGCVNTLAWNSAGTMLLTGSDDRLIKVWNVDEQREICSVDTRHRGNVFDARFLDYTNDGQVVTCAAETTVKHIHLETKTKSEFSCHKDLVFQVAPQRQSPSVFYSCSEDETVRRYDMRIKSHCEAEDCHDNIVIDAKAAIACMDAHPLRPYQMALGCWDGHVKVFDLRQVGNTALSTPIYSFAPSHLNRNGHKYRITSLRYNHDGTEFLVSYSGDGIYLVRPNSNIARDHGSALPEWRAKLQEELKETDKRQRTPRIRLRGDLSGTGPSPTAAPLANPLALILSGVQDYMSAHFELSDWDMASGASSSSSPPPDYQDDGNAGDASSSSSSSPSSSSSASASVSASSSTANASASSASSSSARASLSSSSPLTNPFERWTPDNDIVMRYSGHRNCQTMINEANFFGPSSQFVMSGSDDGRAYVWHKSTGKIVHFFNGDGNIVNCIEPHPFEPIVCLSGFDPTVKVCYPTAEKANDLNNLSALLERNAAMQSGPELFTTSLRDLLRIYAYIMHSQSGDDIEQDGGSEDPPPQAGSE